MKFLILNVTIAAALIGFSSAMGKPVWTPEGAVRAHLNRLLGTARDIEHTYEEVENFFNPFPEFLYKDEYYGKMYEGLSRLQFEVNSATSKKRENENGKAVPIQATANVTLTFDGNKYDTVVVLDDSKKAPNGWSITNTFSPEARKLYPNMPAACESAVVLCIVTDTLGAKLQ